MSICVLQANKTKMVNLLQNKGYKPTVKRARFEKSFRLRAYHLTWLEDDMMHEAQLMTAGGRSYLRINNLTTGVEDKFIHIPLAELNKYEMTEVVDK